MKIVSITSLMIMLFFIMMNTEVNDDNYTKMAQLIIGLMILIPLIYILIN